MKQLEFMDCGHCGKRVAITARRCGHCGQAPHGSGGNSNLGDPNESEEHHAVGGYTAEEDFDYDEFTEEESADNNYISTRTQSLVVRRALLPDLLLNSRTLACQLASS